MRFVASVVAAFALPSFAMAELIPGSDIQSGNWSGGAYTNDASGLFSHCVVAASYVNGDSLYLSVNGDATVSVGVVSPGLTAPEGQTFPVSLHIDNRRPLYGTAEVLGANFAALRLENFDEALTALQKGRRLVIESTVGRGTYDLTGTHRALNAAFQCAVRHLDYAVAPAQPTSPPTAATQDKTLLFQVATQMITQVGASDFVYLTQSETEQFFSADAVYWRSEAIGVLGGVQIVPLPEGGDFRTSDAGDIAFVGGGCEGELATSTRDVSTKDFTSREIRSLCIADGSETEALLTKTLVEGSVLYTVLVFTGRNQQTGSDTRRSMSEDVAIRAASFVRDAQIEPKN
jgi:hypothetical protein